SNYGSTIYKRGAMVASMLRAMSGDTKYFQALTSYQTNRALQSANTDTLKKYFNAVLGTDISEFFRDYIGGSGSAAVAVGGVGNPINTINWNNPSSKKLAVQVASQSKSSGSNVSYFNGPVVLHVKGSIAAQDTTIVFFDWGAGNLSYAGNGLSAPVPGNLLVYNLSFDPVTVAYDDSARTLSTGSTFKLSTLAVKVADFTAVKSVNGNQINLSITKAQPITRVVLLRSFNGIDFAEVGQMIAKGNFNQLDNFQFIDKNTSPATIFYKAEIISADNTEFTKVVKIQSVKNVHMIITPNPAGKIVNVAFSNINREKITIHVMNSAGNLVSQITTNNDFLHFESYNMPNGVYEIQIIQNHEVVSTKKLIIEH
ncbi:MAG TPA: T9SS type A sorting domain-containing protein, partial [Chitinophagaceae bacterium]|nr:T9SS type A sorting domain-containing protein [Chitinophagaceae bacterium]